MRATRTEVEIALEAVNAHERSKVERILEPIAPQTVEGVSKYFNTRLPDTILAMTGSKFPKKFTSHDLRRTVATRLAERLGDEGDKLVRRVLGHSDGSVTAIYNRYGYVREMRRALEQWANDLTSTHAPAHSSVVAVSREVGLIGARATLA